MTDLITLIHSIPMIWDETVFWIMVGGILLAACWLLILVCTLLCSFLFD